MAPPCKHPAVSAIESNAGFGFTCNGCHEMGYGGCYRCKNRCDDYHLHKECVDAPKVAYHHFLEKRLFTFLPQHFPDTTNSCTACGMAVKGWRYYHTLESGNCIFLHPSCMKMPHCIETDEGDSLFLKHKLTSLKCGVCERTALEGAINGWAYVSANQELVCHVRCMKEKMYEDWRMYAHMELNGPWWLRSLAGLSFDSDFDKDDDVVPRVEPSITTRSARRLPAQRRQVVPVRRQQVQPDLGQQGMSTVVPATRLQLVPVPRQEVVNHQRSDVGYQASRVAVTPTRPPASPRQQQQQQYNSNNLAMDARPSSSSRVLSSRVAATPNRPSASLRQQQQYNSNNLAMDARPSSSSSSVLSSRVAATPSRLPASLRQQQQYNSNILTVHVGPSSSNNVPLAATPTMPPASPRQQPKQYNRNSLVLYVHPSSSSSVLSRPAVPAQGQRNNSLALTTTKPTGRKRWVFWKLTKAAVKLLFSW